VEVFGSFDEQRGLFEDFVFLFEEGFPPVVIGIVFFSESESKMKVSFVISVTLDDGKRFGDMGTGKEGSDLFWQFFDFVLGAPRP